MNIRTSAYDAENRQTSTTNSNGVSATYAYDGQGQRVKKTVQGVTTVYVYDALGQLAAEYGGPAPTEAGIRYLTSDHLGSTRLTTKQDGTEDKRYDYLPFGEEVGGIASGNTVKFTSKERDAETGLDFFGARYFSSYQGRFTSPDKPFADQKPRDPQSWNLYSYVRNNPMKFIDPNGRELRLADSISQKDRTYIVQNLAILYSTPAGKAMVDRAEASKFGVTVGTGNLPRVDLSKPGTVMGGQIKIHGVHTDYSFSTGEGHKSLAAEGPDSPTAPPLVITIDKANVSEMGMAPGRVLAHEIGGHLAEVLNAAESNVNQFIDGVNPNNEAASVAAERAAGKLPSKPASGTLEQIEAILKRKEAGQ